MLAALCDVWPPACQFTLYCCCCCSTCLCLHCYRYRLLCREDWLAQLIAELDSTDSYEFVKHLTDVHRLHLFDIVMQYRAIFFDGSTQVSRGDDDFIAQTYARICLAALHFGCHWRLCKSDMTAVTAFG